jgi:hypothetical protein
MYNIIDKYNKVARKQKLLQEVTKNIFRHLNVDKYIKMMNISNNMPQNNMYRMFISYFREKLIAHLLNLKYVGDKKEWETDCVYPNNVERPEEFHIKYEIKIQKQMFQKNGDTNGIILKNGRGEGTKIINLLQTIMKNTFILINGTFPYNIAFVNPNNFIFYVNGKKNSKTFNEIINDEEFLNSKCAELCAYVKKENLIYVHEYDNPSEYKNETLDQKFDPFKEIIDDFITKNFAGN